jgi:hypothetical protein
MQVKIISMLENIQKISVFFDMDSSGNPVQKSSVNLNPGQLLNSVSYVKETMMSKVCRIHMEDGMVLVDVPKDAIEYDKDENEKIINSMLETPPEPINPSYGQSNIPSFYPKSSDNPQVKKQSEKSQPARVSRQAAPKRRRGGCCGR